MKYVRNQMNLRTSTLADLAVFFADFPIFLLISLKNASKLGILREYILLF